MAAATTGVMHSFSKANGKGGVSTRKGYPHPPHHHYQQLKPQSSSSDSRVVYDCENNSTLDRKSSWMSTCQLYRMLVTCVLLSTCAICVFVWITSSVIEKRVIARLSNHHYDMLQQQQQPQPLPPQEPARLMSQDTIPQEVGVAVFKRRNNGRKKKKNKKRGRRSGRGWRRRNQVKDSVHLVITGDTVRTTDYDRSIADRQFFVWSEPRIGNQASAHFNLTRAPHHAHPNDVWGVKVRRTGLYDIYSQIVVAGRDTARIPYNCAQEVLLIRACQDSNSNVPRPSGCGEPVSVLLASYITQHGLGLPIEGQINDGETWFPHDSVYQHGIFSLNAFDEVRVSIKVTGQSDCGHLQFSNANRKAMFFGVAQR